MGDWPQDGAPKQQNMGTGGLFGFLSPYRGLLVKQTTRGCLQECCGCEARSEYASQGQKRLHIRARES